MFFIGTVGFITLLPLVWRDLGYLSAEAWSLLGLLAIVALLAAMFDFEALRAGKISVVEPVISLELPLTVALGMVLAGDDLSVGQMLLILGVFCGIILTMTKDFGVHHPRRLLERGVILAGVGAIGMALTNYLVSVSSQEISRLVTIWAAHSFLALSCGAYLFLRGQWKEMIHDIKKHPVPVLGQSVLDNVAWVSYATAVVVVPVSIVTTITESYIALAVLLGLFVNKETLRLHQMVGVGISALGVVVLAAISS